MAPDAHWHCDMVERAPLSSGISETLILHELLNLKQVFAPHLVAALPPGSSYSGGIKLLFLPSVNA